MKVILATAWFAPFDVGGTEVYLEGLARELLKLGAECTVLVPRNPAGPPQYTHEGVAVETYPVSEAPLPGEMSANRAHSGIEAFRQHLARSPGAIYHQHSWTRGCGPHHLRAARELGFRTALTLHVPGPICLRGTMMRFGDEACDGRIDECECGACWAQSRGASKIVARALAALPKTLASRCRQGESRFATALSARALAAQKGQDLGDAFANSNRIIAVCQWLYDALIANGATADKLTLSRQGLDADYLEDARIAAASPTKDVAALRLVYLGRWDRVKGVDVVVMAVRSLEPEISVRLTIHAIGGGDAGYEAEVRALAAGDPRILFSSNLPRRRVATTLVEHDVLVVPSICLETGPLVVLEAQAAGLFVLGSRLGGIAELVDQPDAGELVEAGNVPLWARAIARLATRRARGDLPRPARPTRTMAQVAAQMVDIYRSM